GPLVLAVFLLVVWVCGVLQEDNIGMESSPLAPNPGSFKNFRRCIVECCLLLRFKYNNMLVEVCSNSLESAQSAQRGGADRIELCSELEVGGVTPSYGTIKLVLEELSIEVFVLIRPRSGNFTYSKQ